MALTNSWGLSLGALRALYRPLEEKLTLVYFDPRGMGGSGPVREEKDRGLAAVRADFQALRAHLKLERVNAIGWSNGAINLVWLAHERPKTLSSAIFVHGMASLGPEDSKALQAAHPDLAKSYGTLMAACRSRGSRRPSRRPCSGRCGSPTTSRPSVPIRSGGKALVAEVFRDAELSWPHAAYANAELPAFDARGLLAEVPVRSLVIAGSHDLLPPSRVKVLADGLPHAEFVVFSGAAISRPSRSRRPSRRPSTPSGRGQGPSRAR